MNILKSRYTDLTNFTHLCSQWNSEEKLLFRPIYIADKLTTNQLQRWKEILQRKHNANLMEIPIFLFQLLNQCQLKNRRHLLLTKSNAIKITRETFQYEVHLHENPILLHLCQSTIWLKRRAILSDEVLIQLLAEFNLIECLSRKRQLFLQLSGIHETFFSLPYYQMRTAEERKRMEIRMTNFHRRKRTIQFHLHATKPGQQAHLTDLAEVLISRHLMYYHVSRYERFDIYHPVETAASGDALIETMFQSELSKTFIKHRPQEEVTEIREHLQSIFDQFRSNHHDFYLRRRSRLPLVYTQHHVPEPTATLDQLIPLTTSVKTVQNLLRVWLNHVLPVEFFGSKYNATRFTEKMMLLVELPRTQQYSLGDVMRTMKLRHFSWSRVPSNRSTSLIQHLYIYHLIYFLVQYVLTLIRSYFYVTEASAPSHPLILVFYRHKIWHVIQEKSHKELIEKSAAPTVDRRDYGDIRFLWKIRFVPKISSVRYLACARKECNSPENLQHLKFTNEILKYLRRQNPHLMGISTFNRAEMHRRWQSYCRTAPKPNEGSMMFFLRSDVSNFYDSVNLDYLDQAVLEFLDKCQFNYDLYIHTIYKTQYRHGRIIRQRTIYWVGKSDEFICDALTDDTKHLNNGIFHDMVVHHGHIEHYNREKLLRYIRAQLFNSHLYTRYQKKFSLKTFRRTIGINHGLPMASMLGQIYLNRIDSDIDFSPLNDEFAVRHEDDLLIISPHRYRLRRIQLKMTKKFNELHRINNPSTVSLKTKTNIRHYNLNKTRPVEYWGSLVDIQSREILFQMNFSEKIERKIRQLTVKLTRETGYYLRHSLINALCLRAHTYYFDRLYTSNETLVRNFHYLSKYFLQRLHGMCVRYGQFYSDKFVVSKSLFLFRTMRAALNFMLKKIFFNQGKCHKLKQQCKYVFFLASIQLIKENRHLFDLKMLQPRFSHLIKQLNRLKKHQRHRIKISIGLAPLIS